jgi:hypothetical protein
MTTAAQIFNYIQTINVKSFEVSSLGSVITPEARKKANFYRNELEKAISKDSIAYKILSTDTDTFSEKQLWVIAFEAAKCAEFVKMVSDFYFDLNGRVEAEKAAKKVKKASKKANAVKVISNFAAKCEIQGRKVAHATFGQGVVISENDATITINFSGVEKQLLKKFAKLTDIAA